MANTRHPDKPFLTCEKCNYIAPYDQYPKAEPNVIHGFNSDTPGEAVHVICPACGHCPICGGELEQ